MLYQCFKSIAKVVLLKHGWLPCNFTKTKAQCESPLEHTSLCFCFINDQSRYSCCIYPLGRGTSVDLNTLTYRILGVSYGKIATAHLLPCINFSTFIDHQQPCKPAPPVFQHRKNLNELPFTMDGSYYPMSRDMYASMRQVQHESE